MNNETFKFKFLKFLLNLHFYSLIFFFFALILINWIVQAAKFWWKRVQSSKCGQNICRCISDLLKCRHNKSCCSWPHKRVKDKQRVNMIGQGQSCPVTHIAVIVWMTRWAWTPAPDRDLALERCVWLSFALFEALQLWC